MKQLSADDRVPENATEDLGDQLDRLVRRLVDQGIPLPQARETFERQFIVASLQQNQGNMTRSADRLGIHRNTLRAKVQSLHVLPADYRSRKKHPSS